MNTLILNPGSRWLKATIYSPEGSVIDTQKISIDDHDAQEKWFAALTDISRIGVRIVHGGSLESPAKLTPKVRTTIEAFASFAPLHNPVALTIIDRVLTHLPEVPVFCAFDTHFHRTLPADAYTYPINSEVAKKYHIRRYGFHGLALESVLAQLRTQCEQEGKPFPKKILMAHLGGGTSVTAVVNGRSVATSMGATPLEGVMMITRSGSIDPDIVRILGEKAEYDADKVSKLLNEQSGFQGLLNSTDTKQIIDDAVVGKQPEADAYALYVRSIVTHLFSYYGLMQGVDALVFSGGIGFHNEHIRPEILKWTEIIGLDSTNTYVFQADEARVIFEQIQEVSS